MMEKPRADFMDVAFFQINPAPKSDKKKTPAGLIALLVLCSLILIGVGYLIAERQGLVDQCCERAFGLDLNFDFEGSAPENE